VVGLLVLAAVLVVLWLRAQTAAEPKPAASVVQKAAAASSPLAAASAVPRVVAASAPAVSAASAPASAVALASTSPTTPAAHLQAGEAWQALGRLWQFEGDLREAGDPCAALQAAQLQCFYSRDGGLALLRLLGRPSLLSLAADAGQAPRYALLLSLGPQTATLQMAGGITQRVSLIQLSRIWRGEFITLWRATASLDGAAASFNGNSVALTWLDQQLSQALGEAPRELSAKAGGKANAPAVQRLDSALRAKVARFQRSQGLPSDGWPGPITVMQLNRVGAVPEPQLQGP